MAVHYLVRIAEPQTHYLEVTATFPAGPPLEVFLPVWTPGSYLVREYSRYLEDVRPGAKSAKNRWILPQGGTVTYRVYAHELTVRTNYVDTEFALIIPAATFLTAAELAAEPCEVVIEHPYQQVHSGLATRGVNHFAASGYDELVDCPIYLGQPAVHEFTAGGKSHLLVNEGESGSWDGPTAAAATQQIVEQYARLMGGLPYDRYLFLNLIVESGGGLEHANSTVLMTSRWAWGNTDAPKPDPLETAKPSRHRWLDLVSHEFFHTWNVKRLRPAELGPFDYERENYTESLWFAEGVTTYYGPLMVRRAGLISDEALLADLSRTISQVQTTPGRLAQSLAEASFDAWIKYYRPHENSTNTTISYYTKGCLVAWILDARLRRATGGEKSLDEVIRLAQARFSGERGFMPGELFALIESVAAVDVRPLVNEATELDYAEALDWFGLRFADPPAAKPWLGIQMKSGTIESILRDSPAHRSALSVGDELIAMNGYRVSAENLDKLLAAAGAAVTITYARRGRLHEAAVAIEPEPRRVWQLEIQPEATPDQRRNFAQWLQSC